MIDHTSTAEEALAELKAEREKLADEAKNPSHVASRKGGETADSLTSLFTTGLRITGDAGHLSNIRITSTSRRHVAKFYAASAERDPVCEANAALYVAAPALYFALAGALSELEDWHAEYPKRGNGPVNIQDARAALALATTPLKQKS